MQHNPLELPPSPRHNLRATSASPTMSLELNTKFATSHCIKNTKYVETNRDRGRGGGAGGGGWRLLLLPSFFSCTFYMCPGERACLVPTCRSPAPAHAPCSSSVFSVLEFAPASLDTLLRVCFMSATVCRCVCVCVLKLVWSLFMAALTPVGHISMHLRAAPRLMQPQKYII